MSAQFSISEEDLVCYVCWDIFREPVVLPCSHSFCKECVQTYWGIQGSRVCPACRAVVPEGELVNSLTLKYICESAITERHRRESELIGLCSQHNEAISLLCLEEFKPVCNDCHTYGEHRSHECRPIQEVELKLKVG